MSKHEAPPTLFCLKCEAALESKPATLTYLGHKFTANVPQCPICGQIYLEETLVAERIATVESYLEDK
jgi:hypothetical protein